MRELYPRLEPLAQHSIDVGNGHVLYAVEYGRADGLPVVVLHGGPGAGSALWQARLFDPDIYRVVLFDQRGCGRSTPHGAVAGNTTADLVADIERVRRQLGIERWFVLGGSWGAALALLYAADHRARVRGLFLRGTFLARARDIDWLYGDGARRFLPAAWREFVAPLAAAEQAAPIAAYQRRLAGSDDIARMNAAKAWSQWEDRAAMPQGAAATANPAARAPLARARIGCHYLVNHCWLSDGDVLAAAGRLAGIPGVIVHGTGDLVCPPEQADAVSRAWPDAEVEMLAGAGHAGLDPAMVDALVRAADRHAAAAGDA